MQPSEEHTPSPRRPRTVQWILGIAYLVVAVLCLLSVFRVWQLNTAQQLHDQKLKHQYQDLQQTVQRIAKTHSTQLRSQLQRLLTQLTPADVSDEAKVVTRLMHLVSESEHMLPVISRCMAHTRYILQSQPESLNSSAVRSSSQQGFKSKVLALWHIIVHRLHNLRSLVVVQHVHNTADRMWLDRDALGRLSIALQVALWAVLHNQQEPYTMGVEQAYTTLKALSFCDHKVFDPLLRELKRLRSLSVHNNQSWDHLICLLKHKASWLDDTSSDRLEVEGER